MQPPRLLRRQLFLFWSAPSFSFSWQRPERVCWDSSVQGAFLGEAFLLLVIRQGAFPRMAYLLEACPTSTSHQEASLPAVFQKEECPSRTSVREAYLYETFQKVPLQLAFQRYPCQREPYHRPCWGSSSTVKRLAACFRGCWRLTHSVYRPHSLLREVQGDRQTDQMWDD